jgi:hypothetical protein
MPGGHDAASGEARAREAARAQETGAREAAFQEAAAQAAAAVDQFINVLLNVDHDTHKFMIIKLVSNIDLRRSIEEVLSTVPIIFPSHLQQEHCELGRMYTSVCS